MTGEPDAHDITMKHGPRVPCGGRLRVVVNHPCGRVADSAARGQDRCRRDDVGRPPRPGAAARPNLVI